MKNMLGRGLPEYLVATMDHVSMRCEDETLAWWAAHTVLVNFGLETVTLQASSASALIKELLVC